MNQEPHKTFDKHPSNASQITCALIILLVLSWQALAGEVPQFVQTGKKYDFMLGVNPAVTTKDQIVWAWMWGYTVTEIDAKTGWITVKNSAGAIRHLNLNVVLAVELSE